MWVLVVGRGRKVTEKNVSAYIRKLMYFARL